ncbi:MAG: hypothetical protein K2Q01_06445, partial [Rickettsiales bacterium]|nr:hypothetical protein [Rickettsiales bacterium]
AHHSLRFAANGEPILRKHVQAMQLQASVQPPPVFNPVDWWRSESIAAPGSATMLSAESYALHCFSESWRWRLKRGYREDFQNRTFPADTLIGSLQHRYGGGAHG